MYKSCDVYSKHAYLKYKHDSTIFIYPYILCIIMIMQRDLNPSQDTAETTTNITLQSIIIVLH